MSTPDGPVPAELLMASAHVPRAGETPTQSVPTPGLALAGARSPTLPTLPDPLDASGVASLVMRFATELLSPSAPSAPSSAIAPAPPAVAPSAAAVESPFASPLRLEALDASGALFGTPAVAIAGSPVSRLSFPLQAGREPGADGPYWLVERHDVPAPTGALAPLAPAPTAHSFELEPAAVPSVRSDSRGAFDPHLIRREFPILEERVHGKRLVWLDNAATTQKPRAVIDRLVHYYEHENSNVHRAAHTLAARATDAYEAARESVRRFLRAPARDEIVFVRGATEGINLVAQSWGRRNVREGDEIVVSWLEHHANIVPWQRLCQETGARLRVAPVDASGQVILEKYDELLGPRTRLVAFTQVSNALGTITPARTMIELAHRHGALVLLDGAQAVSHMPVDVQQLDCDFYVFSGHKVFGPTGIGALYGKAAVLEAMPPWQGGGNMIEDVTFERTIYQRPPARFEAGTGSIADAVGLGAALDWLSRVGVHDVERYEHELLGYATERLATVPGLTMIGTAAEKAGVLSFILAGQKTEQVGGLLDREGIAVRSGHHCAQPILRRFGLEATVRVARALQHHRGHRRAGGRAPPHPEPRHAERPRMIVALSPEEAHALVAKGDVDVVDVREPHEFEAGHLPAARNVPLATLRADPTRWLPRDRVLLVCARGMRSATAGAVAESIGLAEVYHLDGGTQAWLGAGLAVERAASVGAGAGPTARASAEPAALASPEPSSPAACSVPETALDDVVGANLRRLRAARNLTLDQLARMTALSRALLGQIENGRSAPSVSVVWRIAQALDVPFSALLETPGSAETTVLRKAEARRLVSPDGRFSSRALFPLTEQPDAELYEVFLAGHSREDSQAHQAGARENLIVTAGRLELHAGTRTYELETGDAIVFSADVPHAYVNSHKEACWMILCITYARR